MRKSSISHLACALLALLLAGCQSSTSNSPSPTASLRYGANDTPTPRMTVAATAVAVGQPPAAPPRSGTYRVLFDASHGETAGNADWLISASQPDPLGENPAPEAETDWTGALSAWGVALQRTGRYQLMTLPPRGAISYGDSRNPLDLSGFSVFVVPEPNARFTRPEKAAIVSFVQHGGGLFMIADHDGSDRNKDGFDSLRIWNDLMRDNGVADGDPFGFSFDVKNIEHDDPRGIPADATNGPVIRGSFGTVTGSIVRGGTTATLNPRDNPSVRGLLYVRGAAPGGTSGVFFLTSTFGNGRVAAWGDSSPVDDGTGAAHNQLYDGWDDAGGSDGILALNATEWLAQSGGPTAASAPPARTPTVPPPPSPASSPAPGGGGELLQNGDFERGLDGWRVSGQVRVATDQPHGGSTSASLCGANNCAATLAQTINIGAGATHATLRCYVRITTTETRHPYDFLTVELRDANGQRLATIARLSDADASGDWRQITFDLGDDAGRSVELVFSATTGKVNPTTFLIDDVSVGAQ